MRKGAVKKIKTLGKVRPKRRGKGVRGGKERIYQFENE